MGIRTNHARSAITLAMLLALALAGAGCGVAGYAAKVIGEPATPALYIPANKPLVVIIKDQPDPLGAHVESEAIATDIEKQISEYKVAPLISSDKVVDLRSSRPGDYAAMTPARIGHAVGADQVLYIEILSIERDTQGTEDMLRGRITANIRMIDANSGETLWPNDDSGGSMVNYQTPLKHLGDNATPMTVDQSLYAGFADKVVRIFRKNKPGE